MIDTDVVLHALNVLCNDGAAPIPTETPDVTVPSTLSVAGGAASLQPLSITSFIPMAIRSAVGLWNQSQDQTFGGQTSFIDLPHDISEDSKGKITITPKDVAWSKEHLDPAYNYDFTNLKDTQDYSRGGEKYNRPYGWQRFALKVLDKYEDNIWLGTTCRSTESVKGEWPVSYHGTQEKFVKAIIEEQYKAGHRKAYGPGIYSTPDFEIAKDYARKFTCKGIDYNVIMQNRINPECREIYNDGKYWLVPIPEDTSREREQEIVAKAIRPYGILLKKLYTVSCSQM